MMSDYIKSENSAVIEASERAGIGPCMDVKSHSGRIYAIQRQSAEHRGRLCVLSHSLELLSVYEGIGYARQIEIVNNIAVITAREDGLWLFDISSEKPELLCHYHTVEYATGVALYGNLAFVSCRQYGVEVIDISNPRNPRHISIIRVGEVQSATVDNGILFCGCWGEMKVVAVDVNDPADAKVLSEIPLGGRGDGVCVHEGYLYAATGQHARGIINTVDENDPAFGMGNGVEVFDLKDLSKPERVCGARFEKAHCVSIDMWEAAVYGDELIVNNSILGVYALERESLSIKWRVIPPKTAVSDAVTGATSLFGDLFFTTAFGDLFAVRGLALGEQRGNRADVFLKNEPQKFISEGAECEVIYNAGCPVLSMDTTENSVFLASAEGGIHILSRNDLSLKNVIAAKDSVKDVKIRGNLLCAAEGFGGVEIFRINESEIEKIGEVKSGKPIYQLQISESGKYLMCACGSVEVKMFDISCPEHPTELYSYTVRKGPLYGNNFASNLSKDGKLVAFCHRDGLITTDPDRGDTAFHIVEYTRRAEFCGYCAGEGIECIDDKILYTIDDGYSFLSEKDDDPTLIDDMPCYKVASGFKGLLTLKDGIMIASNRPEGIVWIVNIKDIISPKPLGMLKTNASVAKAVILDENILIPGGRQGLLKIALPRKN